MLIKLFILAMFLVILYNLGRGMYFLLHDKGESTRAVKSLTWRIGLSLGLFAFLFAAYGMGWIKPHGIL